MPRSIESIQLKAAKRKAKREAARPKPILRLPSQTKTHPAYRNQLPKIPEMTKAELRGMLAAALAETARM